VFWVISVYFNIRNTPPKSGTFLLGHPVYLKKKLFLKVPHNEYIRRGGFTEAILIGKVLDHQSLMFLLEQG